VADDDHRRRARRAWASGDWDAFSHHVAPVGAVVLDRVRVAPGDVLLDVGAGSGGTIAIPAAQRGAQVVASDVTPELFDHGRRRAAAAGVEVEWVEADAQDLPFPDARFDVVTSTFGAMFAPDQAAAAGELARVTRPGGRLAMANWTPEGGVGSMFRLFAQFQPPPPEGAGMPLDWGRPERVEELLGDAFDLDIEERVSTWGADSAEEYWQKFSPGFGPLKTLLENSDDAKRAEIHDTFIDYLESSFGTPGGGVSHTRNYLLVKGTRR